MSVSSGLAEASVSIAGVSASSASSLDGTPCALAGPGVKPRPAAINSSPAKPHPALEIITPPACQFSDDGSTSAQNCGGGAMTRQRIRHQEWINYDATFGR